MFRTVFTTAFALLLLILSGCKTQTSDGKEDKLPYSPYVEAFTTGKISRISPVTLIFSEEIPADKLNQADIKKQIKFKPDVSGEFTFEDNRMVVFKPSDAFARNTTYEVTTDLSAWFPVNPREKLFTFSFSTLPMQIRATLESIRVNDSDIEAYDILISIYSADRESGETITPLIDFSENIPNKEWQHSVDGKKHSVTLQKVPMKDGGRNLTVQVLPNKLNIPEEQLINIHIPGPEDFSVFEVKLISQPERHIAVTFTQPLDNKQDLTGLATITNFRDKNGRSTSVEVTYDLDGNKLLLYPGSQLTGSFDIQLDQSIRSKKGTTLDETVIRQLQVSDEKPSVEFIGNGVIMPQSSELIVPFRAVYLRGVEVKVIRIMEQNIGQFFQNNKLDGKRELIRVGELVALKTIFLDEDDKDITDWSTYAIDLKELIEPEQGAIYRVELSFNKDLSAYPCDDEEPKSKEEIIAQDIRNFQSEKNRYEDGMGNSYYYYYDYYYDEEDWYYDNDSRDPCSSYYYYRRTRGRNVLATNLGIIAKRGKANEMTVLVNNILTTYPEKQVEIGIYNYQNKLLGSGNTGNNGTVTIPLKSGKPYYILATQGKQRSYLRVDEGLSLSLSNFDVSGEEVQKGIKGFIYGDRGVWRPGDTLYLSFMLNDRNNMLPPEHPVVMELYNPNGQLYLRKTSSNPTLGLYSFVMPTEPDAPTGAWDVKVSVGGVTFNKRLRIETIKPNRLKIQFSNPEKILLAGETMKSKMHVEWLQGAVAKNLSYEMDGIFLSTPTVFEGFRNYTFDDPSKTFGTEDTLLENGQVDEKGDSDIEFKFDLGKNAPGMLMANITTRVFEESGDFSIDGQQLLFSPFESYVGIRSPQEGMQPLETNKKYTYHAIALDYKGKPLPNHELEVNVYRVNWYWWWDSGNNNLANYISDSERKVIKTFELTTGSDGKATFPLEFTNDEWGTFFIRITDKESKHSTGVTNYYDWPYYEGRRDREGSVSAHTLSFKSDKEDYTVGENMTLTVPSSAGSRAIVSIENGTKVLDIKDYNCLDGETVIQVQATEEMQPNVFIHISLLQPHAYSENDLPIRLYGIVPVRITSERSHLNPIVQTADEIKPEATYNVTVSEKDGREMAYTLAIVDEGLLDLTRFKTPDPWNAFNAREALGITTWDLYNYIVGAYGGKLEQIFSIGGDDALNSGPKAVVNRFKPVVQFEGPFLLKRGEKKRHTFTMPNYNGRVRVMVVAGDGEAYGNTEKSVMVRKPLMLLGTLPRVIGIGEEMEIPATVFATEKNIGKVSVSITCSDNMEVIGQATKELNFSEIDDKQATFRIRVKNKAGAGKVTLTASGKGDKSTYETDIEIRSVHKKQTKVQGYTLEGGKSWKETVAFSGADGTNNLTLEASNIPPINLSSRLSYLIGYPHGCLEQITSKGFPQLYLKNITTLTPQQAKATDEAVKAVLQRYRSYVSSSGDLSYWPGGNSYYGWTSNYAAHFMVEAEAQGYLVPDGLKKGVLNSLKMRAKDWKPVKSNYSRSEDMTQAYRLFVLALANSPEIGAMNRMRENKDIAPYSRWLLAASYALIGREDVSNSLIQSTTDMSEDTNVYNSYDQTFGSNTRDMAIQLITLCLLKKSADAAELVKELSNRISNDHWYSTQTTAFALMAISRYLNTYAVSENMTFDYNCAGSRNAINSDKNVWSETLITNGGTSAPLEVKNTGAGTIFLRVITEGTPDQGNEVSYENGVNISVIYKDTRGRRMDVDELEQGTNFVAEVTVKNPTSRTLNFLILEQIFPAGWEIMNTRFLFESDSQETTSEYVDYQDIRDDRVYSYINQLNSGRQLTVRIQLSAVYPGNFYLPPVYCEAMYDHLISANTEGKQVKVVVP